MEGGERGGGLALWEAVPASAPSPRRAFPTDYSAAANRDGAGWCLYMRAQDRQGPSGLSGLVFANTWDLYLKA